MALFLGGVSFSTIDPMIYFLPTSPGAGVLLPQHGAARRQGLRHQAGDDAQRGPAGHEIQFGI